MFEKDEPKKLRQQAAPMAAPKVQQETHAAPKPPSTDEVIRRLLVVGGHAPLCPTRGHHAAVCVCGWGPAAAEAKAAVGWNDPEPA
jgi:hypothetical protein